MSQSAYSALHRIAVAALGAKVEGRAYSLEDVCEAVEKQFGAPPRPDLYAADERENRFERTEPRS